LSSPHVLYVGGEDHDFRIPFMLLLRRHGFRVSAAGGLFAVAESFGTLMGAAIHDEHDTQWFLHGVLTYVLLASVSCLSVARPDPAMRLRGPASIALKLRKWAFAPEWKMTLRSSFAWIIVFALPLMVVMALPLSSMIADEMTVAAKEMARESSEATEEAAALRFNLWQQAIDRGVESGLLGLGPGPHLSIPSSIVAARQDSKDQPKNIEHPTPGAVPNFEAHNTILDLFVQGGLLADLSFLWLMASTMLIGYRAGLDGLTVLVASLFLFGLFHLIIRQPIFWYGVCYCLAASGDVGRDVHRLRHALRGQRGTIFSSLA
jgi:hypothetical protein